MKKLVFLFFALFVSKFCFGANDVRIFEIYAGGGNTSATYQDDFILLFNVTTSPISLNGWSLQYASSTSSSWSKLDINSSTIPARGFLLINVATTTTNGANLPVADLTWTFANDGMAQAGGKVALMQNQILLTTPSPTGAADFVGYGSANASEVMPAISTGISSTRSYVRNNYAIDTDNNLNDFRISTVTEFSSNLPYNSLGPFPIKLSQFTASVLNEKEAQLKWETSSEVGFSHFEVQRSFDALGFESIGREKGKADITEKNEYSFVDVSPKIGQNYYRLKQVDVDGSEEYSKIVSVRIFEEPGVLFYPNPAQDIISLKGFEQNNIQSIKVLNNAGVAIGNVQAIDNKIDLHDFPTQILWIEATLKDGTIYKKRIVKY
jgi:Lamin Tail Domain